MIDVVQKDGVYYWKGTPVFCECLFGRPCKYCNDNDIQEEESINILIDLTV